MKKICLCVEIHIPAFPQKHKAFATNENRDVREMHEEKTVKKVASENILPFFQFIQKIKNHAHENYPSIVCSNLTRTKCFFHMSRSMTWERLIKRILSDNEIELISPSETLQKENHSDLNDENVASILSRSKLRDNWTMNGHQKEAYEKQLDIDTRVNAQDSGALLEEWDQYQDMDHLYFMGDKFVRKQYSSVHFSPFSNPAAAYSNYMETLNNLTDKMQSGVSLKMRSSKNKLAL